MQQQAGESSVNGTEPLSRTPVTFFGFGHSHLTAIQFAYSAWAATHPAAPNCHFAQLLAPPYGTGNGVPAEMGERFGNQLRQELERLAPISLVFTSFSGNEHHWHSLVRHARPFDFVLPDRPDLPLTPGAELVPYRAVATRLERDCLYAMTTLAEICRRGARPLVSLASPPPIPDNNFLAGANNIFREAMDLRGPAPATLRLKFWLLQCRTYERMCGELGIQFLWPPQTAVDANGYLAQEHWRPDGTHAQPSYGAKVLDQLLEYVTAAKAEI